MEDFKINFFYPLLWRGHGEASFVFSTLNPANLFFNNFVFLQILLKRIYYARFFSLTRSYPVLIT
jgi:hypothetical protein